MVDEADGDAEREGVVELAGEAFEDIADVSSVVGLGGKVLVVAMDVTVDDVVAVEKKSPPRVFDPNTSDRI